MATFGNTTDSSASSSSSADRLIVGKFSPTSGGIITSLSARLWLSGSGTTTWKGVIYSDNAGVPGTLLAITDEATLTEITEGLRTAVFSALNKIAISNGTQYWVGWHHKDPGTLSVTWSRGATAGITAQGVDTYSDGTLTTFPTPTMLAGPIDTFVTYDEAVPILGQIIYGGWGSNIVGASYAASPSTTLGTVLTVDASTHAVSSEIPLLVYDTILSTDASLHTVASEVVELIENKTSTLDNSAHAVTSDTPSLVEHKTLVVDNATQQVLSDQMTLISAGAVMASDSTLGHVSDHLTLSQAHILVTENSSHGITSETVVLQQHLTATVNSASHGVSSTQLTLSENTTLSPANSTHSHSATGDLDLDEAHLLIMSDATHAVTSSTFLLEIIATLIMDNGHHSVTSESPTIGILVRPTPRPPVIGKNKPTLRHETNAPAVVQSTGKTVPRMRRSTADPVRPVRRQKSPAIQR